MKNEQTFMISAVFAVALLAACAFVTAQAATAEDYAVIVNTENTYSASKDEAIKTVRRIFLKQKSDWPNGVEGKPFARGDSPAQNAFNEVVLGKNDAAYSDYWIKMKQTEGTVAPRSVGAASILVRQVARKPGSVSVVPASQRLPDNVRTLFTFSHR